MKIDTKLSSGKLVRVQFVRAIRASTSSLGSQVRKGDSILHLSSSRFTGEVFILTPADIKRITRRAPGRWNGRLASSHVSSLARALMTASQLP